MKLSKLVFFKFLVLFGIFLQTFIDKSIVDEIALICIKIEHWNTGREPYVFFSISF